MKTTFIIKINSHTCNEYIFKKIKVSKMQTLSRPESSGCDTFWTEDKKQYNLDYLQLNDSMTFFDWPPSFITNSWSKVKILIENKTTVSAVIKFNKFCKTFTFHIKTSSVPWLGILFLKSNNGDDPIWYIVSTYL